MSSYFLYILKSRVFKILKYSYHENILPWKKSYLRPYSSNYCCPWTYIYQSGMLKTTYQYNTGMDLLAEWVTKVKPDMNSAEVSPQQS
jgi:hypothetical protein